MEVKHINEVVAEAVNAIATIADGKELKRAVDNMAKGAVIFFGSYIETDEEGTVKGAVIGSSEDVIKTLARCIVESPTLIELFEKAIKIAPMVALQDISVMDKTSTCPCPSCTAKREAIKTAVRPLMEWLARNHHPHTQAIVTASCAELLEGLKTVITKDYIQD